MWDENNSTYMEDNDVKIRGDLTYCLNKQESMVELT